MRCFAEFADRDTSFWAVVKYISESLGYSKGGQVSTYSIIEIEAALKKNRLFIDPMQVVDVKRYLGLRAELLNDHVK